MQTTEIVALEGNGYRPSHRGGGYNEENIMFTLNSTEVHAVCFRKSAHPTDSRGGQGWEETGVSDTLNTFRTPIVVVQEYEANMERKT